MSSNSAARVNARRLIEGPKDSLMAVSPMRHTWARDVWKVMLANTWFPQEIDLSRDVKDYKEKLTDAERSMYDKALAFLSNLDGIQFHNIMDNITEPVTSPEVRMCLSRQAWEEANHVDSYATMIEAVSLDPMAVYMTFERDEMLARKNAFIMGESAKLKDSQTIGPAFARALVANIALEGIYFYSGFLAFYVLARNGKMLGSTDMIRLIQRDEIVHLGLFVQMFKTLQAERPELFDREFWQDAWTIMQNAVELETAWGCYIIRDGILGLTEPIVRDYIRHLANERAELIGMPLLFPGTKNPVPWVDKFSDPNGRETNFFEGSVTSYSVGGTLEW
jgi:ribonucleoside-diphosphate reductase beta chain